MYDAYIALGSNMGDRETYLHRALSALHGRNGLILTGLSGIYQTAPVGYTQQELFLNMVCRIVVSLSPSELLETLQEIENNLERTRIIRWGPRTIDLDILLYGNESIHTVSLKIPHPRMFERAFVLVPLREVYPPGDIQGKLFEECIGSCSDQQGITLYRSQKETENNWELIPRPAHTGPC